MEILLIVGVLVLLFGASRLPKLGADLGGAIRNFKKGFSGEEGADDAAKDKPKLADANGATAPAGDKAATKQS